MTVTLVEDTAEDDDVRRRFRAAHRYLIWTPSTCRRNGRERMHRGIVVSQVPVRHSPATNFATTVAEKATIDRSDKFEKESFYVARPENLPTTTTTTTDTIPSRFCNWYVVPVEPGGCDLFCCVFEEEYRLFVEKSQKFISSCILSPPATSNVSTMMKPME